MAAITAAVAAPEPRQERGFDAAHRRLLGWVVLLLSGGYTFLDYWSYSRDSHEGTWREWDSILTGHCYAPQQYRIGVVHTAALLARLTHTHLRHAFAALDFVAVLVSLGVLLWLLGRSAIFRQADRAGQWLQSVLLLGAATLYLMWSFWFQKPETQPTLLLLVLSAAAAAQSRRRIAAGLALIILAALGATVRADVVIAFHAGFLAACLLPQARTLPLGRVMQATVSVIALACATGIAWYIAHRMYPYAPRQNAAFQLVVNLKSWIFYPVIAMSLFPWIATLVLAARRWRALNGWAVGLLLGSLAHFALYYTFGIAWEVRIFLPFAMTVLPLTATLAYAAICGSQTADSLH